MTSSNQSPDPASFCAQAFSGFQFFFFFFTEKQEDSSRLFGASYSSKIWLCKFLHGTFKEIVEVTVEEPGLLRQKFKLPFFLSIHT